MAALVALGSPTIQPVFLAVSSTPTLPGPGQASCISLCPRNVSPLAVLQRGLPVLGRVPLRFNVSKLPCSRAALQEVDVSKVVPQADRVLIRLEELPEKSAGGVLLPKSAVKFEHYLCGEVISVGKEAGIVSKGQKVLFSDLNAYEVNFGNPEKLCFCRAGDLLAVVG